MMSARAWLEKLSQRGQTAVEYIAVLGAVALLLVVGAMALGPILDGAVTAIGTFMGNLPIP